MMNQKSLELEILAIKLEGERANGSCQFQQESNGKKYCISRTLKCPHQQAKIIIVEAYQDNKNWSISPRNLCNYSPQDRQEARVK